MDKKDLKTLLINPPQTFYPGSQPFCKSFPIGLGYIAAVLDGKGYRVEVLDALMKDFEVVVQGDARYYGMSFGDIEKELREKAPHIVGITCPFSAQVDNMITVARIIKRVNPQALVIVGGPHASVRPKELLEDSQDIDIVVMGEGELVFLKIVEAYCAGDHDKMHQINGIAYRRNGQVTVLGILNFIQHLDDLPFPAYHLFDMKKYCDTQDQYLYGYAGKKYSPELSIVTSRGCPYNCFFCSIHLHMGGEWRENSVDYVMAHLKYVKQNYAVGHIHFDDDNLTLNKKRFSDLLDKIIEEKIDITWDTPNGVRADLNFELIKKVKQSGCRSLTMAVESGNQVILDKIIDKKLDLRDVINMAKACHELKMALSAFFVLGFPGETIEDMKMTVKFGDMLHEQYGVVPLYMVATPLYGTRLYDVCKEKGYLMKDISPRALSEGGQIGGVPLIATNDFKPEDVIRIISSSWLNRKRSLAEKAIHKIRHYFYNRFRAEERYV